MWNTFKYTIIALVHERTILFWCLLFPIVLASLFSVMFANIDKSYSFEPIATAIVEDDAYRDAEAFGAMVDALGEEGDDQMLDVHAVANAQEAENLLRDGAVQGIMFVDGSGKPALRLPDVQTTQIGSEVNQTILKDIVERYLHVQESVEIVAENNPQALADPAFVASLSDLGSYTEQISVTANPASESVRYFYALLGFSAIMAANIALVALTNTQANLSALGARRAVGATSRTRTLTATMLASWLLAFACLVIGFIYIRFVLGIDFGGRDALCIVGLLFAALLSTALGTAIGSIPKLPEGAKSGILTAMSCMLALFAGLYGTASQELADELTRTAPLFQAANPTKQVADLFYSLYYYDSLEPFFQVIGIILIVTAILSVIAAIFMRRQRYASL